MAQQDTLFNVVSGPGKWDLLTAFGSSLPVQFKYFASDSRLKLFLPATITSLEHESGGGESWNFKASVVMPSGRREHIKGYYSSHGRNGHFKIVP